MGKKILIGCGAVSILGVLAIVLLLVVSALLGGGETASDSQSNSGGSGSGNSGSGGSGKPATAKVGETIKVGEAEWIVNDAQQVDQLKSQFGGSDAKGNFVVVDFTFTNNTGEAVALDPVSVTLIDGEDREFDADTDSFEYIPEGLDLFLEQVNPGVAKDGRVIFTVAPDAADFRLEVGGAGFFSSETGTIELGF